MNKFTLAVRSYQGLSQAFLNKLRGHDPALSLLESNDCFLDGETTRFYLNWTDVDAGECAGTDWIAIFILFLMVHTVSWWSRWLVWEPVANWLSRENRNWDHDTCKKLSMNMTAAMFFTVSGIFAQNIIFGKPWHQDPSQWSHPVIAVEPDFKFYYLLYAARFFSDAISLPFEDRPRQAFIASCIHHFVTLSLVFLSAHFGYNRIGGVIMSFFDWADPPLLIGKACKYLSTGNDAYQLAANRLFEVFALVFFLTRIILYNYVCFIVWRDFQPMSSPVGIICFAFLVALAALQTYWMGLIVQAAIRMNESGGNVEDVREKRNHRSCCFRRFDLGR